MNQLPSHNRDNKCWIDGDPDRICQTGSFVLPGIVLETRTEEATMRSGIVMTTLAMLVFLAGVAVSLAAETA